MMMKKSGRHGLRALGSLLLCLAVLSTALFGLASCEAPAEQPPVDNRLNFLADSGVSIYRIVYPMENCPEMVRRSVDRLQAAMEQVLGVEVVATDDRGTANAMDQLSPYEILVGVTARNESQDLLPHLAKDEYAISVQGHKIVLLGDSTRSTLAAVDYFIENILGYTESDQPTEGHNIKIDQDYSYHGHYHTPAVPAEEGKTTLSASPWQATVLYPIVAPDNDSDALTLATLQGLAAAMGSEQVYVMRQGGESYLADLTAAGVTLWEHDDDGSDWTLGRLLNLYSDRLSGYLLCSSDMNDPSVAVAISLANQMGAVVVTDKNEQVAQAAGLSPVMDLRGRDDTWLRSTPYFANLSTAVAVEVAYGTLPSLVDYVVMTGCYYYDFQGEDEYMHLQAFKQLEKGAYLVTDQVNNDSEETLSFDLLGVKQLALPETGGYNWSLLSGTLPERWEAQLFPTK